MHNFYKSSLVVLALAVCVPLYCQDDSSGKSGSSSSSRRVMLVLVGTEEDETERKESAERTESNSGYRNNGALNKRMLFENMVERAFCAGAIERCEQELAAFKQEVGEATNWTKEEEFFKEQNKKIGYVTVLGTMKEVVKSYRDEHPIVNEESDKAEIVQAYKHAFIQRYALLGGEKWQNKDFEHEVHVDSLLVLTEVTKRCESIAKTDKATALKYCRNMEKSIETLFNRLNDREELINTLIIKHEFLKAMKLKYPRK